MTPQTFPHRQRGVATLLVVVMVGLSLTAVVGGGIYYNRVNQEQAIALQAQTQAQAKAWAAAEVIREYLKQVSQNSSDLSTITTLKDQLISISGMPDITATLKDAWITDETPYFRVIIKTLTAKGTRAETASEIEVIYEAESIESTTTTADSCVISFNRNLNLSGSITVTPAAGQSYSLNVKGDVTTGGNSITGIDTIKSTGSIRLESGSRFQNLHANGDIQLTGSVSGENLEARGNVCLEGGASAQGTVKANGSVIGNGSAKFGNISTMAKSDNDTGTFFCTPPAITLDSDGFPYGVDLQSSSSAQSIKSKGSVRMSSGTVTETILSERNFKDTNWGGTVGEGSQVGGKLDIQGSDPALASKIKETPGLNVPISPVSHVVIASQSFNAYELENSANYAFKYTNGKIVVTIKNITGISDGDYYLLPFTHSIVHSQWYTEKNTYADYLCKTIDSSGNCTDEPSSRKTICRSSPWIESIESGSGRWKNPSSNKCIEYDVSKSMWTVGPTSTPTIAPGTAWFEGDLKISLGTYYSTFIATKNIASGSSIKIYSPHYAGYNGTINGTQYAPKGICVNSDFPTLIPTQFCKTASATFDYESNNSSGNYALLAGSCKGGICSPYNGGNIETGASTEIYGNVKAGNEYRSGGSTTIYGFITALALGEATKNSMGASTNIILNRLPPNYLLSSGNCSAESTPSEGAARIIWSRYL